MMDTAAAGLDGLSPKEQAYFRRSQRMARRFPQGTRHFSNANRIAFRLTRGRLGGKVMGVPIGLLTTTGRRSGRTRTVPVVYLENGGQFLVVASNSGFDAPPAWLLNLRETPDGVLRTRGGIERVVAHELAGSEREENWLRLVKHNAMWGAYQTCTERQLAVVALEPLKHHESD